MSYVVDGKLVTEIAGVEYVVMDDAHRDIDDYVSLEDYGDGNGGFIHDHNEWDWLLLQDFRDIQHGLKCTCGWCRRFYEPLRAAARRWLEKNENGKSRYSFIIRPQPVEPQPTRRRGENRQTCQERLLREIRNDQELLVV